MKNKMLKYGTVGLVFLTLAGLVLAGCSILPGNEAAQPTATPEPVVESSNIVAEGRIVPRDTVRLAFLLAGEVSEVLVEKGTQVMQGDVLVRLGDAEQQQANLKAAELELLSAQQAMAALEDNAGLAASQLDLEVNQAELNLIDVQQKLADLDTDDYQQEIDDAVEAVNTADDDLTDAQDAFDKVEDLDEDNNTRKNAEQDLEDAQREYDQVVRDRDTLIKELEQARLAVPLAEARLADAQRRLDELQDGIDPDDLALAQQRLLAAEAGVTAAQASLDRLELKAPFNGTITELDLAPGEQVTPNQPVLHIADLSELFVETTDLTENEVVSISSGEKVTIIPDALPDLVLDGVVDSIGDSFLEKSGDITYTVRISLDESDPRLKWGMTVEVTFKP
jgi:multidrug resistance efflux pump